MSYRAITAFTDYKKTATYKPEQLAAYEALLDKKSVQPVDATSNMTFAHELLKQSKSNSKVALSALNSDKENYSQVYLAEKTHRRMQKLGETGVASDYFKSAQSLYPYSIYFSGAKASTQ